MRNFKVKDLLVAVQPKSLINADGQTDFFMACDDSTQCESASRDECEGASDICLSKSQKPACDGSTKHCPDPSKEEGPGIRCVAPSKALHEGGINAHANTLLDLKKAIAGLQQRKKELETADTLA